MPVMRVAVGVSVFRRFRAGDDELSLMNSLEPAQLRRQGLQLGRWTTQGDQLETQVVIEMHVQSCDHPVGVGVLQFQHAIGQARVMMIVNEGQARGDIGGILLPSNRGQFLPQELPNRFTACGELALLAVAIECLEQLAFERDRKPYHV